MTLHASKYNTFKIISPCKNHAQSFMHNISLNSQYIKKAQNTSLVSDNLTKRIYYECLIKHIIYMNLTTFRPTTSLLYKKVIDDLKFEYTSG
jgi:hypothetical protein